MRSLEIQCRKSQFEFSRKAIKPLNEQTANSTNSGVIAAKTVKPSQITLGVTPCYQFRGWCESSGKGFEGKAGKTTLKDRQVKTEKLDFVT